jgi:predicted nucleic acid-binding protein
MSEGEEMVVLDTSALFALIEDEAGADTVHNLLEGAVSGHVEVLVSFISFMELFYITMQERDIEEAQARVDLMQSLPITRVESTASLSVTAAKLKAEHRVSVADAWIAALAIDKNAVLMHKDPEFEQIEPQLKVVKLPYKR